MVEGAALEKRYPGNGIVGSNPTSSALYGISKSDVSVRVPRVRLSAVGRNFAPPRLLLTSRYHECVHAFRVSALENFCRLDKGRARSGNVVDEDDVFTAQFDVWDGCERVFYVFKPVFLFLDFHLRDMECRASERCRNRYV